MDNLLYVLEGRIAEDDVVECLWDSPTCTVTSTISANIIVLDQLVHRWLRSKVIVVLSLSVIIGWDTVTPSFY